jgi:hypothetical protein
MAQCHSASLPTADEVKAHFKEALTCFDTIYAKLMHHKKLEETRKRRWASLLIEEESRVRRDDKAFRRIGKNQRTCDVRLSNIAKALESIDRYRSRIRNIENEADGTFPDRTSLKLACDARELISQDMNDIVENMVAWSLPFQSGTDALVWHRVDTMVGYRLNLSALHQVDT